MLAAAPRTVNDPTQLPLCQLSKNKKHRCVVDQVFPWPITYVRQIESWRGGFCVCNRRVVDMYVGVIDMCFSNVCISVARLSPIHKLSRTALDLAP